MKFVRFAALLCLLASAGCRQTADQPSPSEQLPSLEQRSTPTSAPGAASGNAATSGTSSRSAGTVDIAATDDWKRPVRLKTTPRRVVVIGPGATEIVYAVGKGNLLVGRDSASDYPPQASRVPIVGDYRGPFLESVRAVRPELIIVQGETYDPTRLATWEKQCGAPVVGLAAVSVDGVRAGIRKIGAWLGADSAQVERLAKPATLVAQARGSVFVEVSRRPLMTAGDDTLIGDAIRQAGLTNVARIRGYKSYSLETLATQNPRYYLVTGDPASRAKTIAGLQAAPGLKNLECIRAGRVLVVNGDLLLRPGPRLDEGIQQLATAARAASKQAQR